MSVKSIFPGLALAALTLVTIIMAVTVSQYASMDTSTGFLQYKQEYIGNRLWLDAFYVHVFTCFLCLIAGLTQFLPWMQQQHRLLHRSIGIFYVVNILFINVPSGMILAFQANGGAASRMAFVVLDLLWAWTTTMAWIHIKRGNVLQHRAFMIRSFALTLSAISFRLWKQVWLHTTDWDPALVYKIDAWLGFIPNLLLAELLIRRKGVLSALKENRITQYKEDQETQQS